MTSGEFETLIESNLSYTPNDQQKQVIGVLSRFCAPTAPEDAVFLLNGYAGTGKTSLCGALVKSLRAVGTGVVLLAPTGRAAKVFSNFAGMQAYTIHRYIYRYGGIAGVTSTQRQTIENSHKNTVFIVDEASMITASDGGDTNILQDLIHYVYTGERCRLMFIGDTAQLPPVGCDYSPAMSPEVLRDYGLRVTRVTLTKIARQQDASGILRNATWLRNAMRKNPLPSPEIFPAPDVKVILPEDVPEELYNAYSRDGMHETIVITRSNQRAVGFNREIRGSVLYLEERLSKGEMLIVSKNSYSPSQDASSPVKFLANGDIVEVQRVIGVEQRYGLWWADVEIGIPDTDTTLKSKILLDTLALETANLPREKFNQLYYAIMEDPELFGPYTPMDARLAALKKNPYWNALHVKYAYSVTCHKAQGGQWKNVFVDMSYVPAEAMGLDFYRWLYTAVTRATDRLYVIRETSDR